MNDMVRPLAVYAPAGPKGRLIHCPVAIPNDWQKRAPRPLSEGL